MTVEQQIRFRNLCEAVNENKISMNRAYKEAQKPFLNANGDEEAGFGSGFKDWVTHAQDEGWIDQAFSVLGGIIGNRNPPPPPPPPPAPPKSAASSPLLWVGIGAVVIVGGIALYKLSKAK